MPKTFSCPACAHDLNMIVNSDSLVIFDLRRMKQEKYSHFDIHKVKCQNCKRNIKLKIVPLSCL